MLCICFHTNDFKPSPKIKQIFNYIDITKYHWFNILSQNEVLKYGSTESSFCQNYYSGEEFEKYNEENDYVIFLKLQACNQKEDFLEIHEAKDFDDNNTEILLLVYDSSYFEIYMRDELFENIYKAVLEICPEEIELYVNNDFLRKRFDIR